MFTLPHAGTYFVKVACNGSGGGPDYFYSLILSLTGTISGTVNEGGNLTWGARFWVYDINGNCLTNLYLYDISDGYTLAVPARNVKVYCDYYNTLGEWCNHKTSYGAADVLPISPGGNIPNVNFNLIPKPMICPRGNQSTFATGDTLTVDISVTNGSLPSRGFVEIYLCYPDQGMASYQPIGNSMVLYSGVIDVAANADFTVPNFFSYTFGGHEPPGEYSVWGIYMDAANGYGDDNRQPNNCSSRFNFSPLP